MKKQFRQAILLGGLILGSQGMFAQTYKWYCSTEGNTWTEKNVKLTTKESATPLLTVNGDESIQTFRRWGTCFNELGWDALNLLSVEDQQEVMKNLFADKGDLRFSMGRIPMNANDYARDWYSCDEVDGDFQLQYFNIDRDKQTLIPYIKRAMRFNPNMTFWVSPWSPPSWMKVNHYYSVRSSDKNTMDAKAEVALYENGSKDLDRRFYPKQPTVNNYFIMDERYLSAYANYFCKFVSAYDKENISISRVMFQNEPWAYSIYPACAWTPEGIIEFNVNYLAPELKKQHPDVDLYLGTLNTNRIELVDQILSDERVKGVFKGVGFQWWGGQVLERIRAKYPEYAYIQTENECGSGTFDWKAAEHTFHLINHYVGNGCEEYTIWNSILCDEGKSSWGWKQNALIRVNSTNGAMIYTPEYYAVKHFSNKVVNGTKILKSKETGKDKLPATIFQTPDNKYLIVAANFEDVAQKFVVKLGAKVLDVELQPHSFNTFEMK